MRLDALLAALRSTKSQQDTSPAMHGDIQLCAQKPSIPLASSSSFREILTITLHCISSQPVFGVFRGLSVLVQALQMTNHVSKSLLDLWSWGWEGHVENWMK